MPPANHKPRERIRRAWLAGAYAALVIASQVYVRVIAPPPPTTPPGSVRHVTLPAARDDGLSDDATSTVAYRVWPDSTRDRPVAYDAAHLPVVALHGSPGDGSNFSVLAPRLTPEARAVIAPDLPGFGWSSRSVPSYSTLAHARSVLGLMDELGIERAHVLAWSNGGNVALHMADLAPDRVATITMIGATGAQDTEGSGSYVVEHIKYAVGFVGLVALPELIPHFGLLGDVGPRYAFLRNFWDTDQRPMRAIMARLRTPVLILHGRDDFLIADWAAEEHHDLVPTSSLAMLEGMHFLPFTAPNELTRFVLPFIERHDTSGVEPQRFTVDLAPRRALLGDAGRRLDRSLRHLHWAFTICIAGLLVLALRSPAFVLLGVAVGAGRVDLAVALCGAWLGEALRWNRSNVRGASFGASLRVTLTATLWILASSGLTPPLVKPAGERFGTFGVVVALALTWLALWLVAHACTRTGRRRLVLGIARARHHEFWPAKLFYAPLLPWLCWLAIKHRHPLAFTCANPGIPHAGGLAGESKFEILTGFGDDPLILAARLVPPDRDAEARARRVVDLIDADDALAGYPIILKPDRGERGTGVRLVRSPADVIAYCHAVHDAVVVQRYHPGPHECGVFWIRDPDPTGPRAGSIYAITRKAFPELVGDGRHTIARLITRHPRYRLQAPVFLARFAQRVDDVPGAGERLRLTSAGNHAQGAIFTDGSDLRTDSLEDTIDALARSYRGLGGGEIDFGRFDVRYASEDDLRAGRGLGIIEFNGTSAEATNLYDPQRSTLWAYRVLFGQWSRLYALGAWRHAHGVRPASPRQLLAWLREHQHLEHRGMHAE